MAKLEEIIDDVMGSDPSPAAEEPTEPTATAEPKGEPTPAPEPEPEPAAEPAAAEPAAPAPAEPQPSQATQASAEELAQRNAELETQLAAVAQRLQVVEQRPPQAPAAPTPEPQADGPAFNLNTPDHIIEAMVSEDSATRKQAVNSLINGLANLIHKKITTEVPEQLIPQLDPLVRKEVAHRLTAVEEMRGISEDFYGKFPQLNTVQIRPLVERIANDYMARVGEQPWSPQLRDAIGGEVLRVLSSANPQPTAQPQPQPQGVAQHPTAPRREPPRQLGGGARPQTSPADALSDEITATFGG